MRRSQQRCHGSCLAREVACPGLNFWLARKHRRSRRQTAAVRVLWRGLTLACPSCGGHGTCRRRGAGALRPGVAHAVDSDRRADEASESERLRLTDTAIGEAARVLRPGGRYVVVDSMSPDDPELDAFLDMVERRRDPTHVRSYRRDEWMCIIERAGLQVERVTSVRKGRSFEFWLERGGVEGEDANQLRDMFSDASNAAKEFFEIQIDGDVVSFTTRLPSTPQKARALDRGPEPRHREAHRCPRRKWPTCRHCVASSARALQRGLQPRPPKMSSQGRKTHAR